MENRNMNKLTFYLLSFTWGLPLTLIGFIVGALLMIAGKKPERWGACWHFKVGKNWGGVEFGLIFLTDNTPSTRTKNHEHGHAIQNCYLGVLMPFIVCIPSAIRYWLREFKTYKSKIIYSTILVFCIGLIGCALIFIPLTVFDVIGRLLMAYAVIISIWLFEKEIPQYKSNKYIDYDDIWFEGQATKLGTIYATKWNAREV